jgi:hypothetical protein
MRKILLLFYCLLLGLSPSVFGGARYSLPSGKKIAGAKAAATVTGKVISSQGESLVGVNSVVKGTSTGTITDADGKYSISVPENSILVFSFIGFNTEEISVDNRTVIDVTLMPNLESLSEVVVVGYGTQLRSQISGAVSNPY